LTLSGLIQKLQFPENPEIPGNPEMPEVWKSSINDFPDSWLVTEITHSDF
jgi:hypothetical protein